MSSTAKRVTGIALALVLVLGVVAAVVWGRSLLAGGGSGGGGTPGGGSLTVVHGVIGSEKQPFFDDPGVKKLFASEGLDVQVTTAGSRQIATSVDLSKLDFAFPSSAPAAEKIRLETKAKTTYAPFYSPMAVASFGSIATLLKNAGIATQDADGTWHLDMKAYLAAVQAGTRWNQLPGAAQSYNSSRSLLISSTDVRQSNSAAMYLAIASYVANGDNVVSSSADEDGVIGQMGSLFLQQGFSASSSEAPFDDYLSQGVGSKPLVMIYEAQFLGRELGAEKRSITKDMVLMYPSPTVLSKHTVVPITDAGDRVGRLLQDDARFAKLEAEYGFRPADPQLFADTLKAGGLAVPPSPVDVVDPPSYETLESMITAIAGRYDAPPAPASDHADQ